MDHMDTLEFQNVLCMPLAIAASTWQITPNLQDTNIQVSHVVIAMMFK